MVVTYSSVSGPSVSSGPRLAKPTPRPRRRLLAAPPTNHSLWHTPAITLLLLPFVWLGLFLLRRNFQRGGVSRNLAAGLARRMAKRAGGLEGGGGGVGGVPWMQGGAPAEVSLFSRLAVMLGEGLKGMELLGALRRCILRSLYKLRWISRFREAA